MVVATSLGLGAKTGAPPKTAAGIMPPTPLKIRQDRYWSAKENPELKITRLPAAMIKLEKVMIRQRRHPRCRSQPPNTLPGIFTATMIAVRTEEEPAWNPRFSISKVGKKPMTVIHSRA